LARIQKKENAYEKSDCFLEDANSMNFKRLFFIVGLLVFAASFGAQNLRAQTQTTGDLTGTVTDPSGAVVPSAKVSLKDNAKGAKSDTVTNKEGVYHFFLLPPGSYTVTANATGFQAISRSTTVNLGQVTELNFQVSMTQTTQTVTVTEQPPLLQTSNGNFATTVDEQAVSEVPNPGNDLTYVAQTTPGVVMNTSAGSGNFSSFGISANSNLITLNGMDDNDPFFNVNNSGATNLTLGKNEVQEVTVVTNGYSGEYGGLAGASVNYVTRSGSNDFHGRAIYYWNGRALNANSWFNNDSGTGRSFVNANQWGGDFGGPIKKDKLFFYVNDEGLRLLIPTSAQVIVPSQDLQTATIANLTNLGLTNSIPFYQNVFSLYNNAPGISRAVAGNPNDPLGCGTFTGLGAGVACTGWFRSNISNATHEQIFSARVDYNIGENDRAFVRFQTDHGFQASYTDPINSAFNAVSTQPQYQGQLVETHTFGNTAVNQFILAGGWYTALFEPPNLPKALSTFPTTLTFGDGSFTNLGGEDYIWPQGRNVTQYQISDDYSRTFGLHTLKVGGRFKRDDISDHDFGLFASGVLEPLTLDAFYNGGVDPNSAADTSVYEQNFANTLNQPVAIYTIGGYVQDEWRVKSNLTVTAALRLDHASNPVCQTGCFADTTSPWEKLSHDPTVPYNQVIKTGLHQALRGLTNLEWQPRVSLAWQPFGSSHDTVVRGGIGIFYDNFPGTIADNFSQNPPLLNGFVVQNNNIANTETSNLFLDASNSNAAFLNGFSTGQTEAQIAASVEGFAPPAMFIGENFSNIPQYQKWSLGVQQGFGHSMSLSVGYVGNHGIHETVLNSVLNAYAPPASSGSTAFVGLPGTVPDSRFGPVTEEQSIGVSNYNGLLVSFLRRFSGGEVSINYTWSHALDEDSNGGFTGNAFSALGFGSTNQSVQVPENPQNLRQYNYGNADYDVRHYLNLNYVWELPLKRAFFGHGPNLLLNGWQVSGTLFARTGLPFTPFDGTEGGALAGTNYGAPGIAAAVFATYVGGGYGDCSSPSPNTPCLNTNAFTTSPNGFGNMTRNQVFGPHYFNTDLTIMKKTKIPGWERGEFGLGFQFFNVFNHPNFDNPYANVADTTQFGDVIRTVSPPTTIYGSILGADASPRTIQLKAQLTF
jgi:hypothetical protein